MSKYFANELIELNQLFLLWFDKDFDTRRASDNNLSSVLVKRDKYENILTITSINKGYLPSSPITAIFVLLFPTPSENLQIFE